MTIIKKKIKYTKTRYRAYPLLNDVAHEFIQSTDGYLVSLNSTLQGIEDLEFLLHKNLQDSSVNVFIRYSGALLGTLLWKNESWVGYRYLKELQNLSPAKVTDSLIPKLDRSVSYLVNYKLYDNITQLQVKVDEYQLVYTKYGRDCSIIDIAESDRYLRGRGNYSV